MKNFLISTLGFIAVSTGIAVLLWQPFLGQLAGEMLFARTLDQNIARNVADGYPDDSLIVGICGAGSPLPDPTRTGPCTFVQAGDQVFVIDMGSGSARTLAMMRVDLSQLQAVLLTHFHSDHIDGLGELMLQYWAGTGARQPLQVMGPEGVAQVARGFNIAYGLDRGYRIEHHGADFMHPEGFGLRAKALNTLQGSNDSEVIYSHEGLTITVFPVDHSPIHPAVGYRFDYRNRSVVISGDTKATESVLLRSKGVDLLVHEALQPRLVAIMEEVGRRHGSRMGQIAADIPDYHASPEEVAELAQSAGVKHLLLSHIVPPLPTPLLHKAFLGDAGQKYSGEMTIAGNGTLVVLPAESEEIILLP